MPTPQEQQARALYVEAMTDLIRHYSGETPRVSPVDGAPPTGWPVLDLGFGGFQMCGSSTLAGTADTVRHLEAGDGEVTDPEDWLAELNNQVLGRLKNKLVRVGVSIKVSTPFEAAGGLLVVGAKRPNPASWWVRWSGGELFATLSLAIASHVVFTPGAEQAVQEEGSLCLF